MIPILFISYYFPPQGGAGVQRSLKFTKQLPEFGVLPIVITAQGVGESRWTPKDETLMSELSSSTKIHRFEWPDWRCRRAGLFSKAGQNFLEQITRVASEAKAIIVTMSPFDDAPVAQALSRRLSIPWIADLRDPWALDEFLTYRSAIHRRLDQCQMHKSLIDASCIIMNTPEAKRRLQLEMPAFQKKRVECITNGFDRSDFAKGSRVEIDPNHFTIVHTGTFHTELGLAQKRKALLNSLLGRTRRGVRFLPRSPYYIFRALREILIDQPSVANRMRFICAGVSSSADEKVVAELGLENLVEFTGYLSHLDSVKYVQSANLLFLPMHALREGERSSIVPGKLYEYMASGRTILAAAPSGDAKDFVINSGDNFVCDPEDIKAIKKALLSSFERWERGEVGCSCKFDFVEQFERRNLTKKLAETVRSVIHC